MVGRAVATGNHGNPAKDQGKASDEWLARHMIGHTWEPGGSNAVATKHCLCKQVSYACTCTQMGLSLLQVAAPGRALRPSPTAILLASPPVP